MQGRWRRTHRDQSPVKVRSLQAAMAAWGPEDCATKVELAAALKRAKEQASVPVKMDPDTRMAAAPECASRLEKAFTVLVDFDGVEVESLRAALRRAQKEAQEVPVAVQNPRERESLSSNGQGNGSPESTKSGRPKSRSVEEAEHKLTQLRVLCTTQQEEPVGPTVADSGAEVQRLQAIVVDLQRQLEHSGGPTTTVGASAARQRSREDFVPSCVEEMQQWIWDRRQDLRSHHGGVGRISQLLSRSAHGCSGDRVRSKQLAVNRGSHGAMIGQQSGYRGDAPLRQQVLHLWRDALCDLGGSASDDEPLMRPAVARCQVAPSAIDIGPPGLHAGGAGHRRGLVVEVAPGVVDGSAVALPSSHVIPDVAESDVLVFDPVDSDEEDEPGCTLKECGGS